MIGIVHDPVDHVTYRAIRESGAYLDGKRMLLPVLNPEEPLTLRTDYSFQQHPWRQETERGLADLADKLGLPGSMIEYRTGGVMNACGVLQNANYCYFKYPKSGATGGSVWDYAATACLFNEVGAFASDIMQKPMDLNREDSTFMNHRGLLFASENNIAQGIASLYKGLAT